jgi:hypothetical protein
VLLGPALPGSRAAETTASTTTTQVRIDALAGDAEDNFGTAVAIDGDLMAVGASYADVTGLDANQGAVYLYQRDATAPSGWTQLKKFTPPSLQRSGLFGQSVALQGDVVAIGAPREDNSSISDLGVVHIFERDHGGANAWGQTKTLTESVGSYGLFGSDVALDGTLLLVGAENAYQGEGAAYLFERTTGWGRLKHLLDPFADSGRHFGKAVALDGDTAVVSQQPYPPDEKNDGAVFVFQRDQDGPDTWGQVKQLDADLPASISRFGEDIAIDGDTFVVGANGAAYVYEHDQSALDPSAWALVKQLDTQEASASGYGEAVAIAGDTIWVSAQYSDAGHYPNQGIIYRYGRELGGVDAWGEVERLQGDDSLPYDIFGQDLGASGTTLAVGASGRSYTLGRGAVYVFSQSAIPARYAAHLPLLTNHVLTPTGVLSAGGTVRDATGAVLGAVAGGLEAPVDVTIGATGAPTETLEGGVTPVGNYYIVGASQLVTTTSDTPLLVGLPVPASANPDHLTLAVLLPAELGSESGVGAGYVWETIPGSYDADDNLFVITLGALLPSGVTMVLIEHPDIEPLPPPIARTTRQAETQPTFFVECPVLRSREACTPDNKHLFEAELVDAYADFVTKLGFRKPALRNTIGAFTTGGSQPIVTTTTYYFGVRIGTSPCNFFGGYGGIYFPWNQTLEVCMSKNSSSGLSRATTRHELFHAIQAAYPKLFWEMLVPLQQISWFVEGTATAAEYSSTSMERAWGYEPRPIDIPLTFSRDDRRPPDDDYYDYRTQDFWVYTGLDLSGLSLAYLKPIFESGGTIERVNDELPLDEAYWAWVKNQAYEKEEDFSGALKAGSCTIEASVTGVHTPLPYPATTIVTKTLKPLASTVVEINFTQAAFGKSIAAYTDGADEDLEYKVYKQGEHPCASSLPEGERFPRQIQAGETYYVLLSNTSLTKASNFVVVVSGG